MTEAVYTDSSALVKLIVAEPQSDALRDYLGADARIVTSRLAELEVHRAVRIAKLPDLEAEAAEVMRAVRLFVISNPVLSRARELVSARLRSLDAIHLATALAIGARDFVTYDRRLIEPASAEGLRVLHPGLAA